MIHILQGHTDSTIYTKDMWMKAHIKVEREWEDQEWWGIKLHKTWERPCTDKW